MCLCDSRPFPRAVSLIQCLFDSRSAPLSKFYIGTCSCCTSMRISHLRISHRLPQYVIYIERVRLLHGKRLSQEYQTNILCIDWGLILFAIFLYVCFVFSATLSNCRNHLYDRTRLSHGSQYFSYGAFFEAHVICSNGEWSYPFFFLFFFLIFCGKREYPITSIFGEQSNIDKFFKRKREWTGHGIWKYRT